MTTRAFLWAALALALLASLSHAAATFGTLEVGGAPAWLARVGPWAGILAAVAVDLGLAALAWGVGERARHGERSRDLWAGVVVFAALSALANFDHALGVVSGGSDPAAAWAGMGAYQRVKVGALSASLPLLVLYLARILETAVHAGTVPAVDVGADVGAQSGGVAQVGGSVNRAGGRTRKTGRSNGRAPTEDERQSLLAAAQAEPAAPIAELARIIGAPRQTVSRWVGQLGQDGALNKTPSGWKVHGQNGQGAEK